MTVFEFVNSVVDSRSATTVTECRRCGTTVDADTTECPACGSDGIATYEIS